VASLSQGRTAAAQCGLFTHKSVPVIFEPPCTMFLLFLKDRGPCTNQAGSRPDSIPGHSTRDMWWTKWH